MIHNTDFKVIVHRQISQDFILYCPTVEIIHLFNLHCNMALTHSHLAIAEPLCYMWLQIDRQSAHSLLVDGCVQVTCTGVLTTRK